MGSSFVRDLFGICSNRVRKKGVFSEQIRKLYRTNVEQNPKKGSFFVLFCSIIFSFFNIKELSFM
jgi:hypothetical protein